MHAGDGWKPWDYAAGVCIVTEAAGTVCTITGEPFGVFSESMVACSGASLCEELVHSLYGHVDMTS